MNTTLQRAENVSRKLSVLLERYEALKAENAALKSALEEVVGSREELLHETGELKEALRQAKIANGLRGSDSDSAEETKAVIAGLVREIDKCIALLNA